MNATEYILALYLRCYTIRFVSKFVFLFAHALDKWSGCEADRKRRKNCHLVTTADASVETLKRYGRRLQTRPYRIRVACAPRL